MQKSSYNFFSDNFLFRNSKGNFCIAVAQILPSMSAKSEEDGTIGVVT